MFWKQNRISAPKRQLVVVMLMLLFNQRASKAQDACQVIEGVFLARTVECEVQLDGLSPVWASRAAMLEGGHGSSQYRAPETMSQTVFENSLVSPYIRFHAPVIAGDGSILVTTILGQVASYASDGALQWMVSLNQLVESAPTIEGNIAYVSSIQGLHAIDLRLGMQESSRSIWVFESSGGGSASPLVQGSVIYYAALDNNLYAIENVGSCNSKVHIGCNPMVPIVRWQTDLTFSPLSEAVFSAQDERCQRPFEISREASLLCVQCRSVLPCAQSCFFCEDQTVSGYSPLRATPVMMGTSLLVTAWDGLHSLSVLTGERQWHALSILESEAERAERFQKGTSFHRQRLLGLSSMATSTTAVFPSGRWVIAVRQGDGSVVWRKQMKDDVVSSPTLLPGGPEGSGADAILVGVRGGLGHGAAIVCLDLASGSQLWEYQTGSNVSEALQPVVDGTGQVLFLSLAGLRSVDRRGRSRWVDASCSGADTYSSVAISDDGKVVALCQDGGVRGYCCSSCSATPPWPAFAWTAEGDNTSVAISIANRNLKRAGIRSVRCLLAGVPVDVLVTNESRIECILPGLNISATKSNTTSSEEVAYTAAAGTITVQQQDVTLRQCAADVPDWPGKMPCSYLDPSDALRPTCQAALSSDEALFRSRETGADWCSDCSSCFRSLQISVEITVEGSDPYVCGEGDFSYWFPLEIAPDERETPFKLPTDYSQLITQSSLGGAAVLLVLLLIFRAIRRYRQLMQNLEDDEVNQMAAWINSDDLDPNVREILRKAKNRLSSNGMELVIAFAAWQEATALGRLQRMFDKVLEVKSARQFELLREQHPELRSSASLTAYTDWQRGLGAASWGHCRRVLDLMTMFVPGWGDLWAAYLETEAGIYAEKREAADSCRQTARRGRTWDMHYDMEKARFNSAWGLRHTHSLSLSSGCSSHGNTLTKVKSDPQTSVAMRSFPLEHDKEKLTFAYFGEDGRAGVGLASERIALNVEPCSQPRKKRERAWFYQSRGMQSAVVTGVVTVRVVEARIPWGFSQLFTSVRPMVRVRVGERHWETPVATGRKPVWNQEVDTLLSGTESTLYLEVLNDRPRRLPFVLGAKSILLSDLRDSTIDKWYKLYGPGNSVVLVRLQTAYTVPPIRIDANQYFAEAKVVFNQTDLTKTGAVRTSQLESDLSELGYSPDDISETLFLADPSCTGTATWTRFQVAFSQALYRSDIRTAAQSMAFQSGSLDARTSTSSGFHSLRTMPFRSWTMPGFRGSMKQDEDTGLAKNSTDEDMLNAASPVARIIGRDAAAALVQGGTQEVVPAGQNIAERGDHLAFLFLVKKGKVAVQCKDKVQGLDEEEDEERLIGELGPGHLIGEGPCLSNKALSMSFVAKTQCELLKIYKTQLLQKTSFLREKEAKIDRLSSGPRNLRSSSSLQGALSGALKQTRESLRASNPAYDSLVEREELEDGAVHGGRVVQEGATIAHGLPGLMSGDRIQVNIDKGVMTISINGDPVGEPITGFDAEVYPMVFLSGNGASLTPVEERERLIRVVCVGAEDLPRMDLFTGSSDPYCTIHHMANRHEVLPEFIVDNYRTSIVTNCLSPEWNEAFVISPKSRDEFIVIRVWDNDKIGDDDIIGEVAVPVRDIEMERFHEGRYRLEDPKGNMVPNAILHLKFEVSDTSHDYQRARRMSEAWRISLREAEAKWTPKIKDLGPSIQYPSPSLVRAVFQRALSAKLTLPQVRYLFDFWEHFEMRIAKVPEARLRVVRQWVSQALRAVKEANTIKPFLIHPDTDGESWLYTVLQGHEMKRQVPDVKAKKEAETMRKMMAYRIGGEPRIAPGREAMAMKVKFARQTAGAALFLVPGSLSGLMNEADGSSRQNSSRQIVVEQIRRKKEVNFTSRRAVGRQAHGKASARSWMSRGPSRARNGEGRSTPQPPGLGATVRSSASISVFEVDGGAPAATAAPADVLRIDETAEADMDHIERMARERGWGLDVERPTNPAAKALSIKAPPTLLPSSNTDARQDAGTAPPTSSSRQGSRRSLRGSKPKENLKTIVEKRMISVIRLTKYVRNLQQRDA